ncbi:antibiotic biosynthesis monooxygenase [Breoghania sp. JC706]|uniref:antibiotic biosynthesis monooxygenase n=1 Tax=Breoghania sp. JC706 TaxID=3117732 RepID=UPI00300AF688
MQPNLSKDDRIEAGDVVLVNVVQVEPGRQDLALDVLRDTVRYVARSYETFCWSRLYRSLDGATVINQALWKSRDEFETLFSDEEFLKRYNGLREAGTWEYHLYELSDLILPEQDTVPSGALVD